MYTFFSGKNCRRGAGWVNALIVIVMVMVAAGVIFSWWLAGRPVIDYARPATCQTNLHELGIALLTYCSDFDNALPSSVLVNHSKKWSSADFQQFATRVGHMPPVENAHRQTYAEVIYDYIKNKDILYCQSDHADRNDPNALCSYCWKLAIDKAWYGEGRKRPHRLMDKDFPYRENQVILYERQGFHDDGKPLSNDVRINVAFLDSHVKTITLKNATSGDPANCAANSDGEPMYFNYNYATNKGLPDDKTPAKWVDPAVYGDKL